MRGQQLHHPDGKLLGPSTGAARLSVRSPEPGARVAALLYLWRSACRGRSDPRDLRRRRADSDRSGGRGRAEVYGNARRTTGVIELELQQARYEAALAERRYAACDPDNRLIAAQLEKSWEAALRRVEACEARWRRRGLPIPSVPPDFTGLADDLDAAWNAPGVTMRTRQQLLRALVGDIIADVEEATRESS